MDSLNIDEVGVGQVSKFLTFSVVILILWGVFQLELPTRNLEIPTFSEIQVQKEHVAWNCLGVPD